jgi:hypothetical protein
MCLGESGPDPPLRALPELNISSGESFRRAEALLRSAIEKDPNFGDGSPA